MARKKEQQSDDSPSWLTTYSDLVTLLLTFFVLLFSMSTVDNRTFQEMAASLANSLLKLDSGDSILPSEGSSIITIDFSHVKSEEEKSRIREKYIESAEDMIVDSSRQIEERKIDQAKEQIRETVSQTENSGRVQVTEEKEFLLVRMDSEVFFESGSAEISPEGKRTLSLLADSLRGIENEIMVSGHTDNVPIRNSKYKSNWELSTARATNVVSYLVDVEKMDPTKFTATGNGEYRPIGDNNTAEGRQKNRRIEIRIMK
jgi:chemotaxis protein MotB